MKKFFINASLFLATALFITSCGGNSSGLGGGDGIFGEIPGIYRNEIKKIADDMKDIQEEVRDDQSAKGLEKALTALAMLREAVEKAKEEATPIADNMIGVDIDNTVAEGLPYKVDSFKISKVTLPKMSMSGKLGGVRIKADLTLVLTTPVEGRSFLVYYAISDGNEDFYYGTASVQHPKIGLFEKNPVMPSGDILKTHCYLSEPEIPLELIDKCNVIRFISKDDYSSLSEELKDKRKQWKKDAEKDWD